jgi:hypothetical protein
MVDLGKELDRIWRIERIGQPPDGGACQELRVYGWF